MARWWKEQETADTLKPQWVYCVYVCSFKFHFRALDDIPQYIEYYQKKILPSRRLPDVASGRWGGDHTECQRWYDCLPLRLRDESKRHRVVQALTQALAEFQKQARKGCRSERAIHEQHRIR